MNSNFKIFAILLISLTVKLCTAQQNYTLFFEPEINFEYDVATRYSHGLSIENRNFIYKNDGFSYNVKHLEIVHTSAYSLKENQSISLGMQYRFEENFRNNEENEFRILLEFGWKSPREHFSLEQQIQFEQRFYTSTTKYRWRYEVGFQVPLNASVFGNYIKTKIEALFEIAKTQKPELEQRLDAVLGWQMKPEVILEMGLQYRLANYTQVIGHELFLVSAFNLRI